MPTDTAGVRPGWRDTESSFLGASVSPHLGREESVGTGHAWLKAVKEALFSLCHARSHPEACVLKKMSKFNSGV